MLKQPKGHCRVGKGKERREVQRAIKLCPLVCPFQYLSENSGGFG